jgi:hypothetical protein
VFGAPLANFVETFPELPRALSTNTTYSSYLPGITRMLARGALGIASVRVLK